ncbi:MAG: hypothetical protein V4561_10105 [Bacteroidota bacterium]
MARPVKKNDDKRTNRKEVLFTNDEAKQLEDAANESGLSISDFIRFKTLDAIPRRRKASPERALLIQSLGELGRMGNDINKIAKTLKSNELEEINELVSSPLIHMTLQRVESLGRYVLKIITDGH